MSDYDGSDIALEALQEDMDAETRQLVERTMPGVAANPHTIYFGARFDQRATFVRRSIPSPDSLPQADEVLRDFIARVEAENRRDVAVNIKDLVVCPTTGKIGRRGHGGRSYLRKAFVQLMQRVPRHPSYAGQYLCDVPPMRRSKEFAAILLENEKTPKDVVFRLRTNGHEHVFSVVAPSYQAYDPDQIASDLLELTEPGKPLHGTRAYINYRGVTTTIHLVAQDDATNSHVGFVVDSADDTSRAVSVHGSCWIMGTRFRMGGSRPVKRIIHRGSAERFQLNLEEALQTVTEMVGPWLEHWKNKNEVKLPVPMEDALTHLTGAGDDERKPWLKLRGVDRDVLANVLSNTWMEIQTENAVTMSQATLAQVLMRAVDNNPWPSEGTMESLELAAMTLLNMSPRAFKKLFVASVEQGVHPLNQQLNDQITERRERAKEWANRANAARNAGDEESANAAEERAQLIEIEADVIEETGGR